jgi:hypothetical protein
MPKKSGARVEIVSPRPGTINSPLAVVVARYQSASADRATLSVGKARQAVALAGPSGEIRENVTLLTGKNHIGIELDGARHAVEVDLSPSARVTIGEIPAVVNDHNAAAGVWGRIWGRRFRRLTGSYAEVSCPAGVISVNGILQQFSVQAASGTFAEPILIRPGLNHVAVQVGECYATTSAYVRLMSARIVVTHSWEGSYAQLGVEEPGNPGWRASSRRYDRMSELDVETYRRMNRDGGVPVGAYVVSLQRQSSVRTEWTVRVVTDENTRRERRKTYYGILDGKAAATVRVCAVEVDATGGTSITP